MAHNLEVSGDEVAFAHRGAPAWHGLANATFGADETVTTPQMLEAAKLDGWNVHLQAVSDYTDAYANAAIEAGEDVGYLRYVRQSYLVVRTNPFDGGSDVLATVGERYQPYQNEELFAFGDNVLDAGASWEAAGSIKDGRQVFGSLVIPHEFTIDPEGAADVTKTYLMVTSSHDGSNAITAIVTPVRVVCQNTLNMALHGAKNAFKVRHTATTAGRVAQAREALGLTFKYMDKFETEAKALFEASVTDQTWTELVDRLYPEPESEAKGALTKWENKIALLDDLYFNSPTTENIRGTAWGMFNALTERVDYFRSGRGDERSLIAAASGFDPVTNAEKARILNATKALIGV